MGAGSGAQTERLTRTVSIGATGELELTNIAGDIVVTRGSGAAATIEVVKTARGASVEEARAALALVRVEITERGTRAEARTHYPSEQERRLATGVTSTSRSPTPWRHRRARESSPSPSRRHQRARDCGRADARTVSGNVNISSAGQMASGRSISGNIELVDTKVEGALEADDQRHGPASPGERAEPRHQLRERQYRARRHHVGAD